MAYTLTDAGLNVSSASEIREEIRAALEAELGRTIDVEADLVTGSLIAVFAGRLAELGGTLRQVYAERDLNNAQGAQLDGLGSLLRLERKGLASATFDATPTGTPGTLIPSGSLLRINDGTSRTFFVVDEAIIGTDDLSLEASIPGATSLSTASTFEVSSTVSGWTGIGSPSSIFAGRTEEDDAAFRRRIQRNRIPGTTANLSAMQRAVSIVPGVDYVAILNNPSGLAATIDAVSIEAHSYAVVVFPTLDAVSEQTLADVIYAVGPAGIEPSGDQTASVTGVDGLSRDYSWYYATESLIDVTIDVGLLPSAESGIEAAIEEAIELYFDTIAPGDDLYHLRIFGAVDDVPGTAVVSSLTVERVDAGGSVLETLSSPGRDAGAAEVFVLNSVTVTTSIV
jgi:uncharacterized phage protein gp47/JayE